MKFTLACLLFGLFAFSLCLAAPAEQDANFAVMNEGLEETFGQIDTNNDDGEGDAQDNDEDSDDYEFDYEDDNEKDDADANADDDEDGDAVDDGEKDAKVDRRRREVAKLASRYVRDLSHHHTNIISGLHEALTNLMRR